MVSHCIEIKAELADRLDALARQFDLSSNVLASVAIEAMLDLGQWQIAEIEVGLAEANAGQFASDEDVKAVFEKFVRRM